MLAPALATAFWLCDSLFVLPPALGCDSSPRFETLADYPVLDTGGFDACVAHMRCSYLGNVGGLRYRPSGKRPRAMGVLVLNWRSSVLWVSGAPSL